VRLRIRPLLLSLGLGVAAYVVWHAGLGLVVQMVTRVGWRFLVVLGIYAVQVGIRAVALWRVMVGSDIRYRDVLRIRLSAEAVETLTFTGPFVAEPTKGWLLTRRGVPTNVAFAAVVTEYLLYTVVSSCVAVAALVLLLTRPALPMALRPAAVLILVVATVFIAAFMFASLTGIGLIVPSLRAARIVIGPRALRAADQFARIEDLIIGFLHGQRPRLAELLAIETAAHALLVIEIWVAIAALGFPPGWIGSLIIEGGVKFVGIAFAFIPGQFGASEGTYALIASAIGLPAAVGLSLAFVRRLRSLLVAIIGLFTLTLFGDQ